VIGTFRALHFGALFLAFNKKARRLDPHEPEFREETQIREYPPRVCNDGLAPKWLTNG
jgi:hypothetical protein